MATARVTRSPRWYTIPLRVALVTFIGTLLSFAISLLLAIVGTVVVGSVRRVHPDMTMAYRHIALPAALVVGSIIFLVISIAEIRHYREMKALAAIERMN